ncbi:cation efflux protein [Thermothelomyces heterothallicus CBS 203.75]
MEVTLSDKQRVSAAIVISSAFLIAELGVAFRTGSLALMADAFHYFNDLVGFVATLTSITISEKIKHRQNLSFGWQRARVLGAFFSGSFLLAFGVSILLQSVERFISLEEVSNVKLMLIVGCVGLGANVVTAAFLYEHHHHHHHHTLHLDPETTTGPRPQFPAVPLHRDRAQSEGRADAVPVDSHAGHRHVRRSFKESGRDLGMLGALLHVLGDALNNLGVIVAAAVIWFAPSPGRFYADPAVGMGISLMIILSAVPLVRRSGEILLQSAPAGVSLGDISHDLEKIPGIVAVHELHVWRLNQNKAVASAHVVVSDPDVASFMARARTIRECLHAYGIHSTTLQPELLLVPPSSPPPPDGPVVAVAEPPVCQIACGEGVCGHLMCCDPLRQLHVAPPYTTWYAAGQKPKHAVLGGGGFDARSAVTGRIHGAGKFVYTIAGSGGEVMMDRRAASVGVDLCLECETAFITMLIPFMRGGECSASSSSLDCEQLAAPEKHAGQADILAAVWRWGQEVEEEGKLG